MAIKKSLYSISLKNDKNFTQEEIDRLHVEFGGFFMMFVDSFLMPPITPNDCIFEISFEESSQAKGLIENFLYASNDYGDRYNLVFNAEELN